MDVEARPLSFMLGGKLLRHLSFMLGGKLLRHYKFIKGLTLSEKRCKVTRHYCKKS